MYHRVDRVTACISIHALLAESDHPQTTDHPHNTNFYPRSPCGERREDANDSRHTNLDFYPRSPCGERRQVEQSYRA